MFFRRYKNIICVTSLGVLIGLLLVCGKPINAYAEGGTIVASKNVIHVHSGVVGSKTPNGCCTTPYTDTEIENVYDWGKVDAEGHAYHTEKLVYVTKYRCPYDNKVMGTLSLRKDKKYLSVEVSEGANFTIVSYTWSGSASGNSSNATATAVGKATVTVVVRDNVSGRTSSHTLSATIEQKDLFFCTISTSAGADTNSWAKSAILTCVTEGDENAGYQWYLNDNAITQKNGNKLGAILEGDYYCEATSSSGIKAKSNIIHLYIDRTNPSFGNISYDSENLLKELNMAVYYSDQSDNGISGVKSLTVMLDNKEVQKITPPASLSHEDNNIPFCVNVSKNGDYTLILEDNAGNKKEKAVSISNIDTDVPECVAFTRKNKTVSMTISATDRMLESVFVFKDGTNFQSWSNINSDSFEKTINIPQSGKYKIEVTDKAKNVTQKNITVDATYVYGLDETATIYHVHAGTNNGKSPSGCYTTPYTSYEQVGTTPIRHDYHCGCCGIKIGNPDGKCWNCGADLHTNHDDYFFPNCGGDPIYGNVTRYKCTHGDEKVGEVIMRKSTDTGEYILFFEDNMLQGSSVSSYKWTGTETPNTDEFPSVRPSGQKATDVTGLTTSQITVPDFGTYTCVVTIKDGYSGALSSYTFRYKVEDFDLTPPEVLSITEIDNNVRSNSWISIKADEDFNLQFDSQENAYTEGDIKYRKKRTYELHLSDNMSLSRLEYDDSYYNIKKIPLSGKDAVASITLHSNETIPCKLYDMIGNVYEFSITCNHFDNEKPQIEGFRFSTETWTNEDIEVEVVSTDNIKPVGYYISTSEDNLRDVSLYQKSNTFTISQNGTYMVFVCDEAGNYTHAGFQVTWIDKTSPLLTNEENFYLTSNNRKYKKQEELIPLFVITDQDARFATIHVQIEDRNTEFKDMISSSVKDYLDWEKRQ